MTSSARETVRAALGRLFGRARSHRLPFAVRQSRAGKPDMLAFSAAVRDGALALSTTSHRWNVPQANAGGGGGNLAHIRAGVSAGTSCPDARSLPLSLPAPQSVVVTEISRPAAPPTSAVPVLQREAWGRCTDVQIARVQAHRVWLLSAPARLPARNATDWFTQCVPMVRERLPSADGAAARLAAVSGMDEADIQVAGVYPRVPLTRVRQMALANGGQHLRLWLHVPKSGNSVRLWTVTLGRLRSTGRTVQSIREDINL